jgi:hypothetical protein
MPPPVMIGLGDVPCLPMPNGSQIVFAVGGYDVWVRSDLAMTDLTLEQVLEGPAKPEAAPLPHRNRTAPSKEKST